MVFKLIKSKSKVEGQTVVTFTAREGINGTGVRLPYTCGFCLDKDGKPTVAFRSQIARNRHANVCPR